MKKICCIVNPESGLKNSIKVYYEAKNYFETIVREYFNDPTLYLLNWLNEHERK